MSTGCNGDEYHEPTRPPKADGTRDGRESQGTSHLQFYYPINVIGFGLNVSASFYSEVFCSFFYVGLVATDSSAPTAAFRPASRNTGMRRHLLSGAGRRYRHQIFPADPRQLATTDNSILSAVSRFNHLLSHSSVIINGSLRFLAPWFEIATDRALNFYCLCAAQIDLLISRASCDFQSPPTLRYAYPSSCFLVEQLGYSQSFVDRTQQTAVGPVYGTVIQP
ncbi:hypothetical protein B0H19DRAFT_1074337 [Mycena capillaripes]|nr:hypothetical protein B0H19DRAFT_1074337 [Mycena capillaripes]